MTGSTGYSMPVKGRGRVAADHVSGPRRIDRRAVGSAAGRPLSLSSLSLSESESLPFHFHSPPLTGTRRAQGK